METQDRLKAIWERQNTPEGQDAFKIVNDLARGFAKILNKPIYSGEVKRMVNEKTGEELFYREITKV